MKNRRIGAVRAGVIFAVAMACLVGAGCGSYQASRVGAEEADRKLSIKGTGGEMGRGVVNIAFCWLEIPNAVETKIRGNSPGHPFSLVSQTFEGLLGAISGTVWTVERAAGGVFEVLFSPFPPYDPLMEPAFPPYLNFRKSPTEEAEEKEPEPDPMALPFEPE